MVTKKARPVGKITCMASGYTGFLLAAYKSVG